MARARKSVADKLSALDELRTADSAAAESNQKILKAAIADHHYRVAARAATLCGEQLLYDFEPDLLAAYPYFLTDAVKRDPNSMAKKAIVRALVELDCHAVEFLVAGIRYRQPEPVWGGSIDTAVDVRCSCAMGLVATAHPRAIHELVGLLNDSEATARVGAARALACANPREAELLLRCKVLSADPEPEVIGECFAGLMQVEPEESLSFVANYLEHSDPVIAELAALALGESRLQAALPCLTSALEQPLVRAEQRRALLQAIALLRHNEALDYLLNIVQSARPDVAAQALQALALHKYNAPLKERVQAVVETVNSKQLVDQFTEFWI